MVQVDFQRKFPNMQPIKSAPALFGFNGCGMGVYGHRDDDPETGTYVTTWCLCLLFVPIFCLRAYRVGRASRGWYFIGREPLSGIAQAWNLVVIVTILTTILAVSINSYTSTPAYRAGRKMAAARTQVAEGHLADAAKVYQTLSLAGAEQAQNATDALKDLVQSKCADAPLSEAAGVYAAAAEVARRGRSLAAPELVDAGMQLVAQKGQGDPAGGTAVLDAVRPLAVDTRPIDAVRLPLLRKWAATDPSNLDVVVPLASLLEQQDQLAEAKALLLNVKGRLGDGEGARVLGMILGREGNYDDAYVLLWPYVQGHLDRLHQAEKQFDQIGDRLAQREVDLLNKGHAPDGFEQRYAAANKDQQRAMVREYVFGRIKNDPEYLTAQRTVEQEAKVVPVALDLGMIMLQRAQGQRQPEQRTRQLQDAEKVFLAISGFAGQTDEYRMSLGQVYYWLGKQQEGRKLFDELLANNGRSYKALTGVAMRLRQLGAETDSRALYEEAYQRGATPEERYGAASMRAVLSLPGDLDDEITWLGRADPADAATKAELAQARGDKARNEGREDDAVQQFQQVIGIYSTLPRSSSTLNQTALACYAIFAINGDHEMLNRCSDYFQQAVELEPSNTILLYNAAMALKSAAVTDVVGRELDLRALHESGSIDLLRYLYRNQAERDALAQRVQDHPAMARAVSYLEKASILAPKTPRVYSELRDVYTFTQNEPALRALQQRAQAAGLDFADALTARKDFISGAKDAQQRTLIASTAKRHGEIAAAVGPKGGKTAAAALDMQVEMVIAEDIYTGGGDADQALALAQQAHDLAPSAATLRMLYTAHLFRAMKQLCNADPAFATYCSHYRRPVGPTYIMVVAASEAGPFQQKLLANTDMQKAIALLHELALAFPEVPSAGDWAMLRQSRPQDAQAIAATLRSSTARQLEQTIGTTLRPEDPADALQAYWIMQILDKPEEAKAIIARIKGLGIPIPPEIAGDVAAR